MRIARSFGSIEAALAALQSPALIEREDACEFLGDVLERGLLLPKNEVDCHRIRNQVAVELLQLVTREASPVVLESALNSLASAKGDRDLPWGQLAAAVSKISELSCFSYALELLAGTGDPAHEALIRSYLDSRYPNVRQAAAEGLQDLSFRISAFGKP